MDDELNRFVAQKQKELFAKTDVLCALVNITMSHDTNFVYFGVFNPQIDAILSFSWILGSTSELDQNETFSYY